MDAFVAWLQGTALSQAVVSIPWIWPAAETLHFFGLTLVVGIIGLLDLRLVGLFPSMSIDGLRELVPAAIAGFAVNAVTGAIFLVGHPEQYVHNLAWWLKVGCLVLAGVNALIFEATVATRTRALPPGAPTPLAAKCIGGISLMAWFGVLYWGRMLPFVGDAF